MAVPSKNLASLRLEPGSHFRNLALERLAEIHFDEFVSCSNQMVEQEIPLKRNRLIPRLASRQDKMAIDAGFRAGGSRLPTVIALDAPSPDEKVRALLPCFGENEFVVPRLVAAK